MANKTDYKKQQVKDMINSEKYFRKYSNLFYDISAPLLAVGGVASISYGFYLKDGWYVKAGALALFMAAGFRYLRKIDEQQSLQRQKSLEDRLVN